MKRFGDFIAAKRWWIVAAWIVAAVLIVALSPSLSSVESNDQSSFLPKNYESIQALHIAKQLNPGGAQDASDAIVFKRATGGALTAADQRAVRRIVAALSDEHLPKVGAIMTGPQQLAPNRQVQLASVIYSGAPDATATLNAVKSLRSALHAATDGTGLTASTGGQESVAYDMQGSANKALRIVSIGTLLLVLILPALIFGSPFAGLLPVLAVGVIDLIASSLIADAATWFSFKVNQQLSVIFTVVLFGIGTDYILFLLFRYRERLRTGDHTRAAASFALSRAGEAILSAALVVLTSFTALFFAKFGIFSSMAPGLVICVAVMMLAALTLVPALVSIVGPKIFWPSKAWQGGSLKPTISKRIGGLVSQRPAIAAVLVLVLLGGLSFFAIGYHADFSSFSKPQQGTESARGYADLTAAFPAGVTNPTQIYVVSATPFARTQLAPMIQRLRHTRGVATVLPATVLPTSKAAILPVILQNDPYSNTAITDVAGPIRDAVHSTAPAGARAYVGGTTSIFADIQAITDRDLRVLFPIAALFIFIILAVLLRSLVAPLFLLVAVGLGYVATLGATTLIFERLGHDAGLIFFIPLFMYLFVVAIGTDYNILTITRLREEVREGRSPRESANLTVEHSSATVASAGVILAATFASLLLAGIGALSQMGSAVAIGVILSAFVIAPFLIPSIAAALGYAIWWPGHRPARTK